jgi:hypothetical protein
MLDKDYIKKELDKLIDVRKDFYEYLDSNIPKDDQGQFDFTNSPTLDAQDIYAQFFKLDYQARKLRGFLVEAYEFKAE